MVSGDGPKWTGCSFFLCAGCDPPTSRLVVGVTPVLNVCPCKRTLGVSRSLPNKEQQQQQQQIKVGGARFNGTDSHPRSALPRHHRLQPPPPRKQICVNESAIHPSLLCVAVLRDIRGLRARKRSFYLMLEGGFVWLSSLEAHARTCW